jgi:hypothetical protein
MNFDKDYVDHLFENNNEDEYNYSNDLFHDNYSTCFNRNISQEQFIDNFMKIDYDVNYQEMYQSPTFFKNK